jgi:hypothetical protein
MKGFSLPEISLALLLTVGGFSTLVPLMRGNWQKQRQLRQHRMVAQIRTSLQHLSLSTWRQGSPLYFNQHGEQVGTMDQFTVIFAKEPMLTGELITATITFTDEQDTLYQRRCFRYVEGLP